MEGNDGKRRACRGPRTMHTHGFRIKSPIFSLSLLDLVVTIGFHRSSDAFSAIRLIIGCPLATVQRSEPLSHPALTWHDPPSELSDVLSGPAPVCILQ